MTSITVYAGDVAFRHFRRSVNEIAALRSQ